MRKLWIIGDSFSGLSSCGNKAWVEILSQRFTGEKYHVSSRPSRDFQTILDIFLKNLKNISKDDFVILVLPTLVRTRLPIQTPSHDIARSNLFGYNDVKDYFIGTHSYTTESQQYKLESPLTDIDALIINDKLKVSSIINASNASKENYIEILKSLKEYLPFEIFIWSWHDEIESDIIKNKSEIKNEIGFWHTYNDLWYETDGKDGVRGDHHFSGKMHEAFADYLIVKFPQFFK